jgi:hypothetical protein
MAFSRDSRVAWTSAWASGATVPISTVRAESPLSLETPQVFGRKLIEFPCAHARQRRFTKNIENLSHHEIHLAQLGHLRSRLELNTFHVVTIAFLSLSARLQVPARRMLMRMVRDKSQAQPPTGAVTRPPRPRIRGPLGPVKPS